MILEPLQDIPLVKKTADSHEIILGGNNNMRDQSTETLRAKMEP